MAGSWLELYGEYTQALESPSIYHRWVGLSVLGHALGRRVWFPRGDKFPLFGAQMMVVLVGGSGIVRKTTAMDVGVGLFQYLPESCTGYFNVLPQRLSAQKMIQEMTPLDKDGNAMDAVALVAAAELGSFFSKESFNETLATHIIPLNDAPAGLFDYQTLAFGPKPYKVRYMSWEETLWNPCLGLIGCTTESGIARELPEQMLQGGFFGRVLWVWAEDTDRPLNPLVGVSRDDKEGAALQKAVVKGLEWATALRGPMQLDREATEKFSDWYRSSERLKEMRGRDDGLQTGYWPRKDSHIIRIAMLLTVSEIVGRHPQWKKYREEHGDALTNDLIELPTIPWRNVETAMNWLRETEAGRELCTREMGRTKRSQLPLKILRMLERRKRDEGWAERLLIMRRMNRSLGVGAEEVDRALLLLLETKQVECQGKQKKQTRWRRFREPGPFFDVEEYQGEATDGKLLPPPDLGIEPMEMPADEYWEGDDEYHEE